MYNDPNAQQPPSGPYNTPNPYGQQPNPYEQANYSQQPPYAPTQYGAPPYGVPPMYTPPEQPKKSNRTLWIVLGSIGAVLLLICAACSIGTIFLGRSIGQSAQQAITSVQATETADIATVNANSGSTTSTDAMTVAQAYYNAIETQDYATAYSYLDSNMTTTDGKTLTQDLFTQSAQKRDGVLGKVTDFTPTADSTDPTKIAVSVTRTNSGTPSTYTVHIQLTQTGTSWKITSFDNI